MQIYNNVQSPNFRGELLYTPEGRRAIKRCKDIKILEKLNNAKKEIAKTDYFDIEVGKDLKCKIKSLKEAFFGIFESDRFNNIRHGVNDSILYLDDEYTVVRNSIYDNPDEVQYSVIKKKGLDDIENAENIDILTDVAIELDRAAVRAEKRSLSEQVENNYAKKLKQSLLG